MTFNRIKITSEDLSRAEKMMEEFLKMTPEQRDFVYENAKGKIPGIEIAYNAAQKIDRFNSIRKTHSQDQ